MSALRWMGRGTKSSAIQTTLFWRQQMRKRFSQDKSIQMAVSGVALALVILAASSPPVWSAEGRPFTPDETKWYTIKHVQTGNVIDVPKSSTENGKMLELWGLHGGKNQQFRFEKDGKGSYWLIPRVSELPVSIVNASVRPGALVMQWRKGAGDNGKYTLQTSGNGKIQLIAKISNRPLTARGQQLIQGDTADASTQFELQAVALFVPQTSPNDPRISRVPQYSMAAGQGNSGLSTGFVTNQGKEGACVAYAVTSTIASTMILNGIRQNGVIQKLDAFPDYGLNMLDAQWFYDQRDSYYKKDPKGGWNVVAALDHAKRVVIPFKYGDGRYGVRLKSYATISKGKYYDGLQQVDKSNASAYEGRNEMRRLIQQGFPLVARFDYYPDFQATTQRGKPYLQPTGERDGGHAVMVLGYSLGNNGKLWDCQNSWGKQYGIDGYFQIREGICGIDDNMYCITNWEICDRRTQKPLPGDKWASAILDSLKYPILSGRMLKLELHGGGGHLGNNKADYATMNRTRGSEYYVYGPDPKFYHLPVQDTTNDANKYYTLKHSGKFLYQTAKGNAGFVADFPGQTAQWKFKKVKAKCSNKDDVIRTGDVVKLENVYYPGNYLCDYGDYAAAGSYSKPNEWIVRIANR